MDRQRDPLQKANESFECFINDPSNEHYAGRLSTQLNISSSHLFKHISTILRKYKKNKEREAFAELIVRSELRTYRRSDKLIYRGRFVQRRRGGQLVRRGEVGYRGAQHKEK